jgi:hypothetical protein
MKEWVRNVNLIGGGADVVGPHMLYLETSRDSISYEFYKLIEVVFKTFESKI